MASSAMPAEVHQPLFGKSCQSGVLCWLQHERRGMAGRFDRIDGFLGRLFFRGVGLICAIVALGTAYGAWSHYSAGRPYGWTPVILFVLMSLAAGSCVPYCFSRGRTFGEALDAMEGGAGDTRRR